MGKFLLLLVAAVALATGTLTLSSTGQSLQSTDQRLNERGHQTLARTIAQSGLSVAESRLRADLVASGSYTGPASYTSEYLDGEYTVTVSNSGNEYAILSLGQSGDETAQVSRAFLFEPGGPVVPPPPPFLAPAISIGNNLNIKDDFIVSSVDGVSNAIIYAENNIGANEGFVSIDGFGHYGNGIDFNNGQTPEEVFHPPTNPEGLPVHQRVDPIAIPDFDAQDYEHLATQITSSNVSLSGDITLGTAEAPVIWYIDGNVTTSGDVNISGHGTIITRGNVKILHNVRTPADAEQSTFALYTGNDLKIDEASLTLTGQFLVGGNLQAKANTTLVGNITVGNDLQTHGPFTNMYKPASKALTDPFWDSDSDDGAEAPVGPPKLVTVSTRSW